MTFDALIRVDPSLRYPSDAIRLGVNFETDVPNALRPDVQRLGYSRVSVVLNTRYPEIVGGYFLNSRVLAAVDAALAACGLSIVDPEYATSERCPVEALVALDRDELYLLVRNERRVGILTVWQYSCGGGGEFFSDDFVIDLALETHLEGRLIASLRGIAEREDVGVRCTT